MMTTTTGSYKRRQVRAGRRRVLTLGLAFVFLLFCFPMIAFGENATQLMENGGADIVSNSAIPASSPVPVTEENAAEKTTIKPEKKPEADRGAWSLTNLSLTIVTILTALFLTATYFTSRREDEVPWDEKGRWANWTPQTKRCILWTLSSIVPASAAFLLFILTEDMTLRPRFTDDWSLWHLALLATELMIAVQASSLQQEERRSQSYFR